MKQASSSTDLGDRNLSPSTLRTALTILGSQTNFSRISARIVPLERSWLRTCFQLGDPGDPHGSREQSRILQLSVFIHLNFAFQWTSPDERSNNFQENMGLQLYERSNNFNEAI